MAADPDGKTLDNGTDIANFTVCTSIGWGERKKTEFIRCVAFGKLAGIINQYGTKGMKVLCVGEMQTRDWMKDGVKHYQTEVIVNTFKMLSSKSEGQQKPQGFDNNGTGWFGGGFGDGFDSTDTPF